METKTELMAASLRAESRRDAEHRGKTPNKTAKSHVYEAQSWFYNCEAPPLVLPTVVDGFRVMHNTSMCKPYGLFRIFDSAGAEIKRQLSHP